MIGHPKRKIEFNFIIDKQFICRTLLVKSVSPVLKSLRDPPDYIEDYRLEFGSLGQPLHTGRDVPSAASFLHSFLFQGPNSA